MLVRRLSGKEVITYLEHTAIDNAISAAIIDIQTDIGSPNWKFNRQSLTATVTSGTNYIDLPTNVTNVVSGTVILDSDDTIFSTTDLEGFKQLDDEETGSPYIYCLDANGATNIRMYLYPIPDANDTIRYVAETVSNTDAATDIPTWMHALLKDKATENALRDLGFPVQWQPFAQSYNLRCKQYKEHQSDNTPSYIGRSGGASFDPFVSAPTAGRSGGDGAASAAISTHNSTYDHSKLHDAATVLDGTSIGLTISGQQITAEVKPGTASYILATNSGATAVEWKNIQDYFVMET